MSRKDEIMMTMNSSGGQIKFEDTDGIRELFRHTPLDVVLDFHGIPKVYKNIGFRYFDYAIEKYPKHIEIIDQYFEEIMNPFQGGYTEAKRFYLLKKQNELNNNQGDDNGEESRSETIAIGTGGNNGASIERNTGIEEESEPIDGTLNRKMTAKRRGRVKGRRKSK